MPHEPAYAQNHSPNAPIPDEAAHFFYDDLEVIAHNLQAEKFLLISWLQYFENSIRKRYGEEAFNEIMKDGLTDVAQTISQLHLTEEEEARFWEKWRVKRER